MNSAPSNPPPRRRLLLGVAIVLTNLAGGAYLVRHQIGERISRELATRLAAQGYHVTWSSAAWLPGPGVAVRNLELYRDSAHTERLCKLDAVSILKGGSAWNEWSSAIIRCDKTTLTAGSGDAEFKIADLNAEAHISSSEIKTIRLEGLAASGLRLNVEADLPHAPSSTAVDGATSRSSNTQPNPLAGIRLGWLADVKKWTSVKAKEQAPVLAIALKRDPTASSAIAVKASLSGSNFIWRGLWWKQANLDLYVDLTEHPVIRLDRVALQTAEDRLSTSGVWNVDRSAIKLDDINIEGDLPALILVFAPQARPALTSVYSRGAWQCKGAAVINLSEPAHSLVSATFANHEGTAYEVAPGKTILFRNIRSDLTLKDRLLAGKNTRARLWNGDLQVERWEVCLASSDQVTWHAGLRLSDASLSALRSSFQAGVTAPKQDGKVAFSWQGRGAQTLQSVRGNGELRISHAAFYSLPLLGPLHMVIEPLAPGFAKDVASDLKTDHSIASGELKIIDLTITSALTRVRGQGELQVAEQTAHLVAHANLRGLPGLSTAILSEALAFEATGSLSDLHWRPAHLPIGVRDVGEAALGLGSSAVKGTQATLKGVLSLPKSFLRQLKSKSSTQP